MQTNLLWTGREYYSLENCLVTTTKGGSIVNSVIVGRYEEKIYRVEYVIKTNRHWETIFFEVKSQHSNHTEHIIFESNGKGHWTTHDKPAMQFEGCTDIDISLSPFTNTLPVNRLRLAPDEVQEIKVIYFNLLQREIKPVRQKYTRLADTEYRYENVPNDFEAVITTDEQGFVVDYPGLFVQTAQVKSNYG